MLSIPATLHSESVSAQSAAAEDSQKETPNSVFDALATEYQTWRDFSFPEYAIAHGRPTAQDRITEPGMRGAFNRHNDIGMFIEKIDTIDRAQLNAVRTFQLKPKSFIKTFPTLQNQLGQKKKF